MIGGRLHWQTMQEDARPWHPEGAPCALAAELGAGARVACIAPDSGARYLSTTLFEDGG
jgi:hypothetical protein